MGLTAASYQRMLQALLPPGRLWRLSAEGLLSDLFLGCADELHRLDLRVSDFLDEVDAKTAEELLPEYERQLALDSDGTTAERRARVQARLIARQRYRVIDFKTALAPIFGQAADDVAWIDVALEDVESDAREIFRFFFYRDPALPGTYDIEAAQDLIDAMKPSHTSGHAIESINMLCDHQYSLTDRDIIGG